MKGNDTTNHNRIGECSMAFLEVRSTPLAGGWCQLLSGVGLLVASVEGIEFNARRDLVDDDLVKYAARPRQQNSATIRAILADGRRTPARPIFK
jgi:hypothetical protein